MITDAERRQRLIERHHLGRTASDGSAAVRSVAAFHSSDPVTPHLGLWARVEGFSRSDLDALLAEERVLWRMHAMRRTLFIVPTDEAAIYLAGAAVDIHRKERKRVEGWLAADMGDRAGPWLDEATDRVVAVLAAGGEWSTGDVGAAVPELKRTIQVGSGKWVTETPLISRLLFLLAMEGKIVRTLPSGSWRASNYRWAATDRWFGARPAAMDEQEARAGLLDRYLETHGPATLKDIRWWTGWTAANSRAALTDIGAGPVELESGATGYLAADDPGVGRPAGTVAFLPGLDPTPMGWKERDWYLGPHAGPLFDTNGNAGPMVWTEGRVVGGWGQRPDGTVAYELLEDVDGSTRDAIEGERKRLEEWLDGEVVSIRFRTPLERQIAAS